MNTLEELDKLIGALDETVSATTTTTATIPAAASAPATAPAIKADGDAIDAILNTPARVTQVRSLRDDAVMQRFRQEVSDGLIRVDTMGKVLNLVSQVVAIALAGRA